MSAQTIPCTIGIPSEAVRGEARVAATPKTIAAMHKMGFVTVVERGAGVRAGFSDAAYADAGAQLADAPTAWQADIVLQVNAPSGAECALPRAGATVIGFAAPAQHPEDIKAFAARQVNLLAMDAVPRISRAQALDALSAMSNIAGYRAVVEAAHAFGRFFGGQMTAAGNVPPAKVLVIGAGVAGLSAIGTAGNLGAIVRAFDSRAETREQVQSLDAEFLHMDIATEQGGSDGYAKEMSDAFNQAATRLYAKQAEEVDIIITTALIPGKPAPELISKEMVDNMKRGSVVVDLAAANGGNCAYTVPGEKITTANGVHIVGYTNMPARLPAQASQLYAVTLVNLLKLLCPQNDGTIHIDLEDPVLRAMTATRDGEITWPPPPLQVSAQPATPPPVETPPAPPAAKKPLLPWIAALGAVLYAAVAFAAPADFVSRFTVFMLACVAGYYVVWNVTHALHTPLMSVTNAISGIIVLGALLQIGRGNLLIDILAFIAVLIASINIFGGFAVTRRMLSMFQREE